MMGASKHFGIQRTVLCLATENCSPVYPVSILLILFEVDYSALLRAFKGCFHELEYAKSLLSGYNLLGLAVNYISKVGIELIAVILHVALRMPRS